MPAARLRRGLLVLWLAATLALTLAPYGPLRDAPRPFAAASRLGPLDFVLNVVLFLPCGALLGLSGVRSSIAVAGAALLSLAVESAQMYLPHRHPSQLDILANTLGAVAGALVAMRLRRRPQAPLESRP